MIQVVANPCVRCGQERILVKTWKEKIGISMVTYALTKCPDPKCQEIVDRNNTAREEKRLYHANKRLAMRHLPQKPAPKKK